MGLTTGVRSRWSAAPKINYNDEAQMKVDAVDAEKSIMVRWV